MNNILSQWAVNKPHRRGTCATPGDPIVNKKAGGLSLPLFLFRYFAAQAFCYCVLVDPSDTRPVAEHLGVFPPFAQPFFASLAPDV